MLVNDIADQLEAAHGIPAGASTKKQFIMYYRDICVETKEGRAVPAEIGEAYLQKNLWAQTLKELIAEYRNKQRKENNNNDND